MTGDVYRRDALGYYWYVARADDMIVSAGYNIAGPEVESALSDHPAVRECAVVGWLDPERGEIVKAFVVVEAPAQLGPELAKELREHVKRALAPYKYRKFSANRYCTRTLGGCSSVRESQGG
ncbi:MAG: 2-aminobenzoate-CoA ligase [Gammaproteobacteria bacterium]|jgi:2-aminobenzoate-CoA ligase|nr:2-aminobenzoate-CoA ligase [Gammaproteobacteria bacterium]